MTEHEHNDLPLVLFVDDVPALTCALARGLRREPYRIMTADDPHEALRIMDEMEVDVIVSDECMPGMSGSELLARVRERHPRTIRLILTGEANLDAALRAINEVQVYRFLIKPCSAEEVGSVIAHALEERELNASYEEWKAGLTNISDNELQERYESALSTLYMVFQPIVDAQQGEIFGYEALLRVASVDITSTIAMIGLAEELGRVEELDRIVREHVALRAQDLDPSQKLLVNVHPISLHGSIHNEDDPLHRFADRVVLEVTERGSLHELQDLQESVDALRKIGYEIAIDDLGSGYAGLTSFALLTPEIVKFDMELVQNVHRSPTRSKLIRAMTSLCRELGILALAEGIETVEECRTVRELGCGLLQGYYLGAPTREFSQPTRIEKRA